jgi:bacteriocin-like protein
MFEVQSPAQGKVISSQAEALFVELDDEQLATVSGGLMTPVAAAETLANALLGL